jgi:hypothetical protein
MTTYSLGPMLRLVVLALLAAWALPFGRGGE